MDTNPILNAMKSFTLSSDKNILFCPHKNGEFFNKILDFRTISGQTVLVHFKCDKNIGTVITSSIGKTLKDKKGQIIYLNKTALAHYRVHINCKSEVLVLAGEVSNQI